MRVLHLTLKKKWFDMIASGEKKEEYRELKNFWGKRLCNTDNWLDGFQDYDAVKFVNGGSFHQKYPSIIVKCDGIDFGTGKTEWGAEPDKEYFVIKLGDIISQPITTPASDAISVTTGDK